MDVSVNVILLAAGKGTRIGQPKIYLKLGDKYFPDVICDNVLLAGLDNIFAVINKDIDIEKFRYRDQITWIVNPNPEREMISSIYFGINQSPKASGYMIIPVDHPAILRKTFSAMYNVFAENPECIVIAAFNETLGHPIILPLSFAENIENIDYVGGLRTLIKNSGFQLISVETDDPGVLKNVNTQEDFKNLY